MNEFELDAIYLDWILPVSTISKLTSHYLLYWDRIYFNNYLPYFNHPITFPRAMTHNGIRYSVRSFETFPGEWAKGEEQSSRISLSFRHWKDKKGNLRGIVLIKAAIYKEII